MACGVNDQREGLGWILYVLCPIDPGDFEATVFVGCRAWLVEPGNIGQIDSGAGNRTTGIWTTGHWTTDWGSCHLPFESFSVGHDHHGGLVKQLLKRRLLDHGNGQEPSGQIIAQIVRVLHVDPQVLCGNICRHDVQAPASVGVAGRLLITDVGSDVRVLAGAPGPKVNGHDDVRDWLPDFVPDHAPEFLPWFHRDGDCLRHDRMRLAFPEYAQRDVAWFAGINTNFFRRQIGELDQRQALGVGCLSFHILKIDARPQILQFESHVRQGFARACVDRAKLQHLPRLPRARGCGSFLIVGFGFAVILGCGLRPLPVPAGRLRRALEDDSSGQGRSATDKPRPARSSPQRSATGGGKSFDWVSGL